MTKAGKAVSSRPQKTKKQLQALAVAKDISEDAADEAGLSGLDRILH